MTDTDTPAPTDGDGLNTATARRWHFQPKDAPRDIILKRRHWEIGDIETLKGIAIVFGEDDTNAALIVRAVNAHDDLRDCLQAFVTYHGGHVLPPELQARARAVLSGIDRQIAGEEVKVTP